MNGIKYYFLCFLIVFAGTSCGQLFFEKHRRDIDRSVYAPTPVPDRIILTWTGDPSSMQAVTWRTDTQIGQAVAEIAEADATPKFYRKARRLKATTQELETENGISLHHNIVFDNLKPNTLYAYRVGDGKTWSEWFQFTTAEATAEPFSFIYFGDAQTEIKSNWSRVIRQAYSDMPKSRFMLHAGDIVNLRNRRHDSEWGEWFAAGQWIFGMVPSIVTPGNHEYEKKWYIPGNRRLSPQWRTHFTLPENGPEGLEERAYYIDYQGVRIISLDTEAMNIDKRNAISQAKWLEQVLHNNPNRWTIVIHHHPMFSARAGRKNDAVLNTYIREIYERYNVDIVLQGHDHVYARGHNIPNGYQYYYETSKVMYVVSVSGPKMYKLSGTWMDRSLKDMQLYHIVSIDGDTLTFEVYTVTGVLVDRFELHKQDGGPNLLIEQ
jgi:3',5'-cyclic AMP phosphodiesterase CpdA